LRRPDPRAVAARFIAARDKPWTEAMISLFHHIHHEDGEHEVHHCGGEHPGIDYTVEHCSCGLHKIDQQEAVGHGTKGDLDLLDITVTFEDECPDGGWHVETGRVDGKQAHLLLASRVYHDRRSRPPLS
jgi:hypothetical protein